MSTPLLAAKLVELRQQANYSQLEVADYLGMTREGYSHYERDTREPGLESLMKLSRLYKTDISALINDGTVPIPDGMTPKGGVRGDSRNTAAAPDYSITENIRHFLKIFTGKNSGLDLTDITKEDIAVLSQYKQLSRQCQKEVRQFIRFKHSITKNRE